MTTITELLDPSAFEQCDGWGAADAYNALQEDWSIVKIEGTNASDTPFQLQAVDTDAFLHDEEAWIYVKRQALRGSALHRRALAFLKAHSPREHQMITAQTWVQPA